MSDWPGSEPFRRRPRAGLEGDPVVVTEAGVVSEAGGS